MLNSLLLANIMAEEGKPLGQLVARSAAGVRRASLRPHATFTSPNEVKEDAIRARVPRARKDGRFRVLKIETLDGVKFFLDAPTNGNGAEAWVLVRASGTEPLLRLYTEAASPDLVNELLVTGENFVKNG